MLCLPTKTRSTRRLPVRSLLRRLFGVASLVLCKCVTPVCCVFIGNLILLYFSLFCRGRSLSAFNSAGAACKCAEVRAFTLLNSLADSSVYFPASIHEIFAGTLLCPDQSARYLPVSCFSRVNSRDICRYRALPGSIREVSALVSNYIAGQGQSIHKIFAGILLCPGLSARYPRLSRTI